MDFIPWNESAVAVCQPVWGPAPERVIVAEGTLAAVIDNIAMTQVEFSPGLRISLPDRHVAPFQYDVRDIGSLLAARRAESGESQA